MSNEPSSPFIEPLRDAFAAFALESASPSTSLPPNGPRDQPPDPDASLRRRPHSEGRYERIPELQDMQSQLNSTLSGRPVTLSDLWADHNSSQTMSLLHSQFVNELDMDPSQLTVEDYVRLFRRNFQALNDEITKDGQLFVEHVQEYEIVQRQEELRRRIRREQEERKQLLNSRTVLPYREMHEVPYGGTFYSTPISVFPDLEGRGSRHRAQTSQQLSLRHLPGCPQALADLHSPCQLCGVGMEPVSFNNYHSTTQTSGSQGVSERRPNTSVSYHPMASSSQQQHQHYHQSRDHRAPRRIRSYHESQ